MATLRLFTSNRLEILAERLGEVLRPPPASPLAPEIIVVQSKGMDRWLSMRLAEQHGICANFRFPFPNAFVQEIFGQVLGRLPERSPFEPEVLAWRIMARLPSLLGGPGFRDLKTYLGEQDKDLKLYQLSERIADTFDQYLLFRPEMIFRWERDREKEWQAVLWRDLVRGSEDNHRAAFARRFFEAIRGSSGKGYAFPERISVFGISALPRLHLEVLAGLSSFTQVNLFLMNPCKEYWGDILSSREIERRTGSEGGRGGGGGSLHLEKGNSLLASTGTLGRDFFDLINEFDCEEVPAFEDPGDETLLSCLQSDILNLTERGERPGARKRISPGDRSLQIHSCHSPMREMEVLRDQLLDMFEEDPELLPKDVLVMTPDVEVYAPYIQAVFDRPRDDARGIPYSIADRGMRDEGRMTETFLSLLNLPGGRLGASEVLALLETTEVRRRASLSDPDLALIRRWIRETGIRWGMDAGSRARLGLPPFSENTWRAGLDRLLMGYAMAGDGERMFGPILPYDHMEGEETAVLGRFVDFAERLFVCISSLSRPKTLAGWCRDLTEILEGFFAPDEAGEQEMQALRRTLGGLSQMQQLASFDQAVDIRVIRCHLAQAFKRRGFGYGFMTGGVTFCAMVPMRSIPFRVICLAGMNDDAYPRESRPLSFDLMAKHPRPGDRSRRHDDRYLFLEALLSARERLYISYVGQDIQDNSRIQPSVLVSELMDCVEQGFEMEDGEILRHLLVEHRLQPFSPEYFKSDGRLFSYSDEDLDVARNLLSPHGTVAPFIAKGLSEPEGTWRTVRVEDLGRFFSGPVRFLLNRRLAIHLDEGPPLLEDREAFELGGLERYLLEEELLQRRLEGRDLKDLYLPFKSSGRLPPGTVGRCLYDGAVQGIERFVERMAPYTQGGPLEAVTVDLALQGFRVIGLIHPVYPQGLVLHRYARLRARDHLKAWIIHLALNSLEDRRLPRGTILAGLDPGQREEPVWAAWEYRPVEGGREILARLLELYWSGLSAPLPFFPESSWVYAQEGLVKGRSPQDALALARREWEGSDYSRGEAEDPYYRLCFRGADPLDESFQRLALDVFEPLIGHQKRMKEKTA